MLLEALVAGACLGGTAGCGEATTAYYKSSKELQQTMDNLESMGKKVVDNNKYLVYVATPAYAVLSGQAASFAVYRGVIFNVNIRQQAVALQWTY